MVERIKDLLKQGKSHREVAKEVGTATHKVTAIAKEYGIGTRRSDNITPEQIKLIREKYIETKSKKLTGEFLGISRMTVYKYVKDLPNERPPKRIVEKKVKVKAVKPKLKIMKKKKEVKAVKPMVERYELIGKGLEQGVTTLEVKLNPNRDAGEKNKFKYRDAYGVKEITIYVRDGVTREESAHRWCKKFGVNLVGLS